jgi:hypothetical protein
VRRHPVELIALAIALAMGLAVLLLGIRPPQTTNPIYKGHPLSYWANRALTNHWAATNEPEVNAAILHIGTNAFPFVLKYVQSSQPFPRRKEALKLPPGPLANLLKGWLADSADDDGRNGWRACAIVNTLGPEMVPLLPGLLRLSMDRSSAIASKALYTLAAASTNSFPYLLHVAEQTNHPGNLDAKFYVCSIMARDRHARSAVAMLLRWLEDHPNDPGFALDVYEAMAKAHTEPQLIVPALRVIATNCDAEISGRAKTLLGRLASEVLTNVPAQ